LETNYKRVIAKFTNMKKFISYGFLCLFSILFFSGCATDTNDQSAVTKTVNPAASSTAPIPFPPTKNVTETAIPEPTLAPTVTDQKKSTLYVIDASYDSTKQELDITQQIEYQNHTNTELSSLTLEIPQIDKGGVVKIESISINSNKISDIAYSNQRSLIIPLTSALLPNNSVAINIAYSVSVPEKAGVFGITGRQINFSDWYIFVPPYDPAKGWVSNPPAAVGENLVYDIADFDVSIKIIGSEELIIAASSKDTFVEGVHHYEMKSARGFTWSISNAFLTIQEQYGPTTVFCFYFSGDEEAAKAALANSGKALMLFSDLYGIKYDHDSFTIVEADFADGMEYDRLYYLSKEYFKNYDGSPKNYLTLLSVHETAHQWWFAKVHNDQAFQPWLDESMATFSELLYIEQFHPDLVNWWWEYRINTYSPTGNVGMTIYDQNNLRTYINAVYLRGAQFLESVRSSIGSEQFIEDLRYYGRSFEYKIASSNDFLSILESQNPDPVKDLERQYFLK
jgi:hypothetical protein